MTKKNVKQNVHSNTSCLVSIEKTQIVHLAGIIRAGERAGQFAVFVALHTTRTRVKYRENARQRSLVTREILSCLAEGGGSAQRPADAYFP